MTKDVGSFGTSTILTASALPYRLHYNYKRQTVEHHKIDLVMRFVWFDSKLSCRSPTKNHRRNTLYTTTKERVFNVPFDERNHRLQHTRGHKRLECKFEYVVECNALLKIDIWLHVKCLGLSRHDGLGNRCNDNLMCWLLSLLQRGCRVGSGQC